MPWTAGEKEAYGVSILGEYMVITIPPEACERYEETGDELMLHAG